jgi:hypothetical protein
MKLTVVTLRNVSPLVGESVAAADSAWRPKDQFHEQIQKANNGAADEGLPPTSL